MDRNKERNMEHTTSSQLRLGNIRRGGAIPPIRLDTNERELGEVGRARDVSSKQRVGHVQESTLLLIA